MVKDYFIFGDVNTLDFNGIITDKNTDSAPARIYSEVKIAGKNGVLLVDDSSYSNVDYEYTVYFHDKDDARDFIHEILARTSYKRLEDNEYPEEYRMACINADITSARLGFFHDKQEISIKFTCKPQRFLKSGEIKQTLTVNGDIWNPSPMDSLPLIRVYGYGTLKIGSTTLTIANYNKSYMDIDCELMDCFNGSANLNNYVTMSATKFPALATGKTGITFSGNITKVEITPRWWRL